MFLVCFLFEINLPCSTFILDVIAHRVFFREGAVIAFFVVVFLLFIEVSDLDISHGDSLKRNGIRRPSDCHAKNELSKLGKTQLVLRPNGLSVVSSP